MEDPTDTFEVPPGMVDDMKIAVPLLSGAMSRGIGRPVEVEVIESNLEGFGVAEAAMALLSVPVAGMAILSKKWLEEVVWPELKPRLTGPTHQVLDYLLSLVPAGAKEP